MNTFGLVRRGVAIGVMALAAGCGQVNLATSPDDSRAEVQQLQTDVAALSDSLAAQSTIVAEQAAQATRLSDFVLYLATVVPRVPPTLQAPSKTPYAPFLGQVVLEGGKCCAGGTAGEPLTLRVDLEAQSKTGAVTEMRIRAASTPATLRDMAGEPWVPFSPQTTVEIVPPINWVGLVVSVQFRDSSGAVSDIFWDDISVEGMPPAPTPTP